MDGGFLFLSFLIGVNNLFFDETGLVCESQSEQ
jgi:hypothetical protein